VGATLAPVRPPDAVKSCARSAENKLTSCHATVRLPKSCAWVPTLIRLRLRQRAAVESSQNLGVVMTTLEMLFQNGHECLRSTQGTRRNFFEALPWFSSHRPASQRLIVGAISIETCRISFV